MGARRRGRSSGGAARSTRRRLAPPAFPRPVVPAGVLAEVDDVDAVIFALSGLDAEWVDPTWSGAER